MPLTGNGSLGTIDPAFHAFLDRINDADASEDQFVARNAVLDERVGLERARRYHADGAAADHGAYTDWEAAHQVYLEHRVAVAKARGERTPEYPDRLPDLLDPVSFVADCPETFDPDFGNLADVEFDLVHLVRFPSPRDLETTLPDFEAAAARVADSTPLTMAERDALDAGLEEWNRFGTANLRPTWVGLWREIRELFGDTASGDVLGWADTVRDRFGLLWQGTPSAPVRVLLFRYAARLVPRWRNSTGHKLLAVPSILDGGLYAPFFPVPERHPQGHAVSLTGIRDAPNAEYVHAAMAYSSHNLFRVGALTRSPVAALAPARKMHIDLIRQMSRRPTYAEGTDP